MSKLARHADKAEGLFSVTNGIILAGNHKLQIEPVLEQEGERGNETLVAIRFEVIVDGTSRPDFSFDAIGISTNKAEARNVAFGEWYMGFGVPLFRAVSGKDSPQVVRDYNIYSGYLGVRGDRPESWVDGSATMNIKILEHVVPAIPLSEVMSLNLKLVVPPSGKLESECRINGKVSTVLADRLMQLDWPRGTSVYMFKQAYVLVKKKKPTPP